MIIMCKNCVYEKAWKDASTCPFYYLGLCDENSRKYYISDADEDYLKEERKREN